MSVDKQVSNSTFNVAVCAIRFFYEKCLKVPWKVLEIPYKRKPKKLPAVLSQSEIQKIFLHTKSHKYKLIFMCLYSGGLRISEALQLKATDIDSERMMIHIKCSKGNKDRYVPLSYKLLEELRNCWILANPKPTKVLFPGEREDGCLSRLSPWKALKRALKKSNINKAGVSLHSLRHSYATHLLESGVNLLAIQVLLGHSNLKTTMIYTHLAQGYIENVQSPLDSFPKDEK